MHPLSLLSVLISTVGLHSAWSRIWQIQHETDFFFLPFAVCSTQKVKTASAATTDRTLTLMKDSDQSRVKTKQKKQAFI